MQIKDLMAPVSIVLPPEASLEEARRWFILSGANVLVITKNKDFFGIIERRVVENAIRYGLTGSVIDFADPDVFVIDAEETLSQEIVTNTLLNPKSLALVVHKDEIVGILSFRELLPFSFFPKPVSLQVKDVDNDLLYAVQRVADKVGIRVFLVGGGVRDLFLGKAIFDIDFVVSEKAEEFARSLSISLCGRLKARSQFKTYKIELKNGQIIDIAQSRWEYYDAPATLPKVAPGSLWEDLFRRDFTINAMALGLSSPFTGMVLDFFGGIRDLRLKKLRIHHILSFVEDPTRIFRAARYVTRFNLKCTKAFYVSLALVKKHNILSRLSPARIRGELKRILEEPFPAKVLAYLLDLGIFDDLFRISTKELSRYVSEIFSQADGLSISKDDLLEAIGLVFSRFSKDWPRIIDISKERAAHLKSSFDKLEKQKDLLLSEIKFSKKIAILDTIPTSVLLVFSVFFPFTKGLIREYLLKFKNFSPRLRGKDLIKAGIKPGPEIGVMLKRLREAWLDGEISSPEQELEWLRKEFPNAFP